MNSQRIQKSRAPCRAWRTFLGLAVGITTLCVASAWAQPKVFVSGGWAKEGLNTIGELVFRVSVEGSNIAGTPRRALDEPIFVDYKTMDLTASSSEGDYGSVTGTLRLDAFGATKEVRVPLYGDPFFELDETVALELVRVENGVVDDPRAIGTILNDDTPPSLSIDDVQVVEGAGGATAMTFAVTLSRISGAITEVDFATADGTATVGDGDYQAVAQHLVIPAWTPSQRVVVEANGDLKYETSESFGVLIDQPVNATILRGAGVGTLFNDDAPLGPNLVANSTFNDLTGWAAFGGAAMAQKPEGVSGPHSAELSGASGGGEFGIEDSPNWVKLTPAVGTRYRVSAWVMGDEAHGASHLCVDEYLNGLLVRANESQAVELTPEWKHIAFDVVSKHAGSELDFQVCNDPTVSLEGFHIDDVKIEQYLAGDIPPEMKVVSGLSIRPTVPITLDLLASDPDGQAIDVLSADLSDFPATNPPVFEAQAMNASARLKWVPRPLDVREAPYQVRFTAMNSSATTRTVALKVTQSPPNLVSNDGFEANLGGWQAFGGASLTLASGGKEGYRSVAVNGPVGETAPFGLRDHPDWVTIVASEGATYDIGLWVRSDANVGDAYMVVTEMMDAHPVGMAATLAVPLSPTWTPLTLRYVTRMPGTSLSLEVVNLPKGTAEVLARCPDCQTFQVDQVAIQLAGQAGFTSPGSGGGGKRTAPPEASSGIAFVSVQPNPARGSTTLSVMLTRPGPLHVAVYDASGRQVRTLASGESFAAGTSSFVIERSGKNPLANGIYFYRVLTGAGEKTGRFVVLD